MTSSVAIAVALFLLLNDVTLIYEGQLITEKNFTECMIYLLSVCVLLRRLQIMPKFMSKFHLEIPLTTILLELSLVYTWTSIEQLVEESSEQLLQMPVGAELEWLFCKLRCGKNLTFPSMMLKIFSFVLLLGVCRFRDK
ncbi:hypothetical protein JYU34_015375 [Plutella xylostella]|uniref:Uncharacterized protein n=1 Tax=Plutella xylostella TaxID=51655 RepID=A0ABQ7Q745_PLUXY|nr:hypothetical protein JYU34_015375 [Plutella xylostella]